MSLKRLRPKQNAIPPAGAPSQEARLQGLLERVVAVNEEQGDALEAHEDLLKKVRLFSSRIASHIVFFSSVHL